MAHAIETVKQAYAEFGKGNIQGVLDLLDDDASWSDPGYPAIPYAGKRTGKKEIMNFFSEMSQTLTFTRFEPREFYSDGNIVTAKGFFSGLMNENKNPFESDWVMLWEVRDGKIKSYQAYVDTFNIATAIGAR